MDDMFKNAISEAKKVSLKKDEFGEIRSNLISFMEKHGFPLFDFCGYIFRFSVKKIFATAFVIMMIASIGTSFAAELSLPGDLLYPIKIHFNEKIIAVTAVSEEARAKLNLRIADRRLKETEGLMKRDGSISAVVRKELENDFKEHISAAGQSIQGVRDAGDYDKAAELDLELEEHSGARDRIFGEVENDEDNGKSRKNEVSPEEDKKEEKANRELKKEDEKLQPSNETEEETERAETGNNEETQKSVEEQTGQADKQSKNKNGNKKESHNDKMPKKDRHNLSNESVSKDSIQRRENENKNGAGGRR